MSRLPHLSAPTLADQAYEAIREAIMSGVLRRGEKVTERGLADSLNISATPVREALRRLEQDRLVERSGPRDVRVAKFDADELREITLIEDSLRALAARLAAEKATASQLEEMRSHLDRADALREQVIEAVAGSAEQHGLILEIMTATREFHTLVDRASASPTLIQMLQMVHAFGSDEHRRSVLAQLESDQSTIENRYHQHRAIFEAIAAHDPDRAEALMRDHSHSSNASRIEIRRTS